MSSKNTIEHAELGFKNNPWLKQMGKKKSQTRSTNEISENIKSQRKQRQIIAKNEFEFIDDKKDEEMVMQILKGMKNKKGTEYIKQFMFNAMHELCYKNNKKEKIDAIKLSQLINTEEEEMCNVGHSNFKKHSTYNKDLIMDNKCIQCNSLIGRKCCWDCSTYDKNDAAASYSGRGVNASDVKGNIYCIQCRKANSEMIKKRIKTDKIKSEIIRDELVANPNCELDLSCNMPRSRSLELLLFDINKLSVDARSHWVLFMLDLDYLKAWNTAIGHGSTDKLIKAIGDIMHKYNNEINNGKWSDPCLKQSFIFRTGGDEFVMVVKCGSGAPVSPLYNFYNKFKSEINGLGANIQQFIKNKDWKTTQQKIESATDREGTNIDLSIVGISCGIFIPYYMENIESDWLEKADTRALEAAKKSNGKKKNGCCIYYELMDLIPNDKTEECLKKGVYNVYNY